MDKCYLCPRMCGADRKNNLGFCGAGEKIRVARASLHMWEEPCISGKNGSGTIFFSGCTLKCCFCQNYKISAQNFGIDISKEKLCEIMLDLQSQGAHNINFVTPTHYADKIASALLSVKDKLHIPTIYNSSGYEKVETLDMLDGLIDIYMPDLKYFSSDLSKKYSRAHDYFEKASRAIIHMYEQAGSVRLDKDGMLEGGVVIRHMVLPGAYKDSVMLLDWLAESFDTDKVMLSLMCQYTPQYKSSEYKEINRRLTTYEYEKVTDYAEKLGFSGFMQKRDSASEKYIPDFDLSGVK